MALPNVNVRVVVILVVVLIAGGLIYMYWPSCREGQPCKLSRDKQQLCESHCDGLDKNAAPQFNDNCVCECWCVDSTEPTGDEPGEHGTPGNF